MTRHLCISVTLLDPLFHGKGDPDSDHPDGRPEWPPSPMRLFQALLAGACSGCRSPDWTDTHAEAFRWLERLDPPRIVGPDAQPAPAYTLFVPNNDADRAFDRQDRLTSKIVRPLRLDCGKENGGRPTLHYLWPIPDAEGSSASKHAPLLCREARHLMALGWGIDQAVAEGRILGEAEGAALPGRSWRPWRTHRPGSPGWRVPVKGSLDDLRATFESFLGRIDGNSYRGSRRVSQFDTVHYLSSTLFPPRAYAAFELPEGLAFRPEDTVPVAAMLRSLACRSARSDTHAFPGGSEVFVAGHVERQEESPARFSYLPLPTVGHAHADGMIRRLLIAEPSGRDATHAAWAQRRLCNEALRDKDGRDRGILLDLWRPSSARILKRYVGEAQRWCTVTPVVLPGFDDRKQVKAERLFLAAAAQAGLPVAAIERFALRKAPFWPGARHPRCYTVPDYLRHLPGWHVWLQFRERVPGPLAIGAGRHIGLGLFAMVDEAAEPEFEQAGRAGRRR
jgi:CRISPR-associated protein Csb2